MEASDTSRFDLFAPTPLHELLSETLRKFVSREVESQAAEHDRSETFNHALFRRAGEMGFLGITIREEYGGSDLGATAAVQVYEAISGADPGFALSVLTHSVLFAQNVQINADDTLKRRILPLAVSGEWIGGLCMTEPEVGTDVLAMRTRARRDGDAYVIDGTKMFITNGGIDEDTLGDAFVVYASHRGGQYFLLRRRARDGRLSSRPEMQRQARYARFLHV